MSLEQILHMHETLNLLTKFIEFCWVFFQCSFLSKLRIWKSWNTYEEFTEMPGLVALII